MDETMIDSHFSFYDNQTPWSPEPGQNFLIRGFAYRETMPRGMIRHGDKTNFPWPWLLIYFHDPVTIMSEGTLIDAGENTCGVDAGTIFIRYLGMFQEELKKDSGDFFFQQNLLQLFLYDLYRQSKRNFVPIPQRLWEMEQYLSSHLREDLTMEELASRFGITTPHFRALFRKHFNAAPMHYLHVLRLNKAARLLQFYPYSCKEVAEMTGFRDPLYFSRCFRRFWGVAPSDYREHAKERTE